MEMPKDILKQFGVDEDKVKREKEEAEKKKEKERRERYQNYNNPKQRGNERRNNSYGGNYKGNSNKRQGYLLSIKLFLTI